MKIRTPMGRDAPMTGRDERFWRTVGVIVAVFGVVLVAVVALLAR